MKKRNIVVDYLNTRRMNVSLLKHSIATHWNVFNYYYIINCKIIKDVYFHKIIK